MTIHEYATLHIPGTSATQHTYRRAPGEDFAQIPAYPHGFSTDVLGRIDIATGQDGLLIIGENITAEEPPGDSGSFDQQVYLLRGNDYQSVGPIAHQKRMGQGGQSVTTSAILLAYTHLGLLYRYRTIQLISGSIYRRGGDVLMLGSNTISLTNNSGDNEILSVVNIQYMVREPATDPVKWFVYVSPLRRVYRSSLTTTGLTLEEFVGSPPLVDRYNAGAAKYYQ